MVYYHSLIHATRFNTLVVTLTNFNSTEQLSVKTLTVSPVMMFDDISRLTGGSLPFFSHFGEQCKLTFSLIVVFYSIRCVAGCPLPLLVIAPATNLL